MSAYNFPEERCFVTASDLPESTDERECPFCGKRFDDDGRARAFYLRHIADCKDDFEGQSTLGAFGISTPNGEATDAQVRHAIETMEAEGQ